MALLTQVSFWGPETLRGNGASARAKHQQATAEKVSAVTTERINMLKTLKRKIALGAVAAVGAAGLVTIAAPAANALASAATAYTVTGAGRVGSQLILKFSTTGGTTGDIVAAVATSVPTGAVVPGANGTTTVASSVGAASLTFTHDGTATILAAGNYSFLVWLDGTGSSTTAPGSTASAKNVTVTIGGAPASLSVASATISAATSDSDTVGTAITVSIKDAAGVATLLKANESITATTGATAWVKSGTAAAVGTSAIATAVSQGGTAASTAGTLSFAAGNKTALTDTISIAGAGLLSGQLTAQSITITTFATVSPNIKVSATQTGVSTSSTTLAAPNTTTGYAGAQNLFLSPATGKSLVVSPVTSAGNAGGKMLATIAAAGTGLPTGVTAGTTQVTLDSTGAGSFTVASSAPVAGTGYTLAIGGATLTVVYTAPVATTVAVSAPTQKAISAVVGGKTTITAKVKDQFGDGVAGALMSFFEAVGTRNSAAVGTLLATIATAADGSASYTLTDASTSTTALVDKINISAISAGSAASIWATATSGTAATAAEAAHNPVTITYVTSVTPATVTVAGATAAPVVTSTTACTATAPCLALDTSTVYTATLKNASGTTLSAGIPVTWAITNGYAASATSYTDANGAAVLTVFGSKKGALGVTATAGGTSGSSSTITVTNATTDARTIALDAATYAIAGGSVKRVSATVKDRYGNIVSGVNVSFAFTGIGRFAGGSLTATGTTDSAGVAIADIAPLTNESGAGSLTATYTGGDAATSTVLPSDGVTAYPAATTTATAATTTTAGGVSTDAATAAAQKATDAKIADIATAVTNLSTTVAGLVASLVAQIKDTKAAITATQTALTALAAVVNKIKAKVKA